MTKAAMQAIRLWLLVIVLGFSAITGAQSQSSSEVTSNNGQTTESSLAQSEEFLPLEKLPGLSAMTVTTNPDGSQEYTVTLQILAIMTALTFLPAILMMMTSFTRIIIVFAILRQALGLQQSPSNQILIGLSLFLTLFIMSPVFMTINEQAITPYINEDISSREALANVAKPMHDFMMSQTRETDIKLFMDIGDYEAVDTPDDVPFVVLIPAFVTSELKTAFQIGFIIFIPFLVIDIVVASVLMAMGMMMLSPLIISLPFKIMLFVLVDGWSLVIGSLAASFGL